MMDSKIMTKTAGRPRSTAADDAILRASAKMFFQQAFNDVSMESIAIEAGVSKATLYRRFPNKYFLAIDVLLQSVELQKRSFDIKNYQQHLTENLKALRNLLASNFADVIMALIAQSQQDVQLREAFVSSFLLPVQAIGDADLKEAIELGQIKPDTDKDLLFDQMFGFFFYRLLVIQRDISDKDIETVVNSFMKVAKTN
jgi:AcrR family transcriptional regulator